VNLLVFAGIVPVFLVWFFRVRQNAGLWGPQSRSQGWTVGAWFTPVVNFWFPMQIMRDVWRASDTEPNGSVVVGRLAGGCRAGQLLAGQHCRQRRVPGPRGGADAADDRRDHRHAAGARSRVN
jgi:hypothetical protein